MNFQSILSIFILIIPLIFGETTTPTTVESDTLSSETVVNDELLVTIKNEEASVPDAIVRDVNDNQNQNQNDDETLNENINLSQHPHQTVDQQQHSQMLQQHHHHPHTLLHQWNNIPTIRHFHIPLTSPRIKHVYRINGRQLPQLQQQQQSHRSINLPYSYPYVSRQVQDHQHQQSQEVQPQQQQQHQQTQSKPEVDSCQGTAKRNVDVENENNKQFESWYLNTANHDLIFSICGTLLPAHRILIESKSSKFSYWINKKFESNLNDNKTISINSIDDLIEKDNDVEAEKINNQCPNNELLEAFKIFLHYFYTGINAFDSIDDINVSFYVFELIGEFIDEKFAESYVEPKIIHSMKIDNINRVYRYWKNNKLDSLKLKWSRFISEHSSLLIQNIPFSCDEIINDIELLDQFLQNLNTTQSEIIRIIQHYLEYCPETIHNAIKDADSLPNSLYFFRCTIDDLKQLQKIGFITYEILAEELENRLRAKERVCEELRRTKEFDPKTYNYFQQMEPYLGAFRRRA